MIMDTRTQWTSYKQHASCIRHSDSIIVLCIFEHLMIFLLMSINTEHEKMTYMTLVWLHFRFSAPKVWNSVPVSIRESQSIPTCRRHLKIFLLLVGLPPFSWPPWPEYLHLRALIFLSLWRYINHVLTYLLTYLFTYTLKRVKCE